MNIIARPDSWIVSLKGTNYRSQVFVTKLYVEYYPFPYPCTDLDLFSQAERQASITASERNLDATHALPSELLTLTGDIEEKKMRLNKIKADIKAANYDERLAEKMTKGKTMEDRKDMLTAEFRTLNTQADTRAKLDLKRAEVKSKTGEIKNT